MVLYDDPLAGLSVKLVVTNVTVPDANVNVNCNGPGVPVPVKLREGIIA